MLSDIETQLLEVPDLLQSLLRVAQEEARSPFQTSQDLKYGAPSVLRRVCTCII